MPSVSFLKNNWSSGEISPRAMGRVDTVAYQNGASVMENMIPLPGGGAIRRPGTYYVGEPRSGDPAKLLVMPRAYPFESFIVELTHLKARLWDTEQFMLVQDNAGLVELTTPYVAADLPGLSAVPMGDAIYIAHKGRSNRSGGGYAVRDISRVAVDRTAAVCSGASCYGAATALHIIGGRGNFLNIGVTAGMILHTVKNNRYTIIDTVNSATDLTVTDQVLAVPRLPRTPDGSGVLQYDTSPYVIYRGATTETANKLIDAGGTFATRSVATGDVVYNVKTKVAALVVTRDSETQLTLDADIFEVGDPYIITHPTIAIATTSFSGDREFAVAGDFPSVVFSLQGRLGLGGTLNEPDMIALSRGPDVASGSYRITDFTLGENPDDAIVVYATESRNGAVKWAAAHRRVCVGGEFSTWQGPGGVCAADTFYLDYISGQSCSNVTPTILGKAVFYISAPRPHLHMLLYSEEGGGMMDLDLSAAADHILEPGVVAMAAMAAPIPLIWVLRADGMLVSCTVDMSAGSITPGWARHPMGGDGYVEDIAVAAHPMGDKLWLVVNREASGRTLEYLTISTEESDDFGEVHYVDCGLRVHNETPSETVAGLDHLEDYEVDAVADGGSMPRETVASGEVSYDRTVSEVHIGLPFRSVMRPCPPELVVNGTWQAKKKRVDSLTLRLLRTIGGKAGHSYDKLQPLPYFKPGVTLLAEPPAPFTGDVKIELAGQIDEAGAPYIVQDQPWPLTVLAAISRISILET